MELAHLFHARDDTADIVRGLAGFRLAGGGLRNAARDEEKPEGYAQGDTHTRRPAPLGKGELKSIHAGDASTHRLCCRFALASAPDRWNGCPALNRLCLRLSLMAKEPIVLDR
jgi:hypothetical protein